jgi:hypothetical protein
MTSYASEMNGARPVSPQEVQQLLQQTIARPIEQAKQIADVNAEAQGQEQKAQEAGKGEVLDIFG